MLHSEQGIYCCPAPFFSFQKACLRNSVQFDTLASMHEQAKLALRCFVQSSAYTEATKALGKGQESVPLFPW